MGLAPRHMGHPRRLPLAVAGGHVAFCHFLLLLRQTLERTGRARGGARDRHSHRPNGARGQCVSTLLATRAVVERALHGDGSLVLVGMGAGPDAARPPVRELGMRCCAGFYQYVALRQGREAHVLAGMIFLRGCYNDGCTTNKNRQK